MRFKFLDPYEKEDKDYFFGREDESYLLTEMVLSTRLTVVYGASGVGKTSLVRCGLSNRLLESDWELVFIKRAGFNDINEACFYTIRDAGFTYISEESFKLEKYSVKTVIRSVYNDIYKSIVFVFDQFEEVFIHGINEEISNFILTLKSILECEIDIRIVIIIRDDYFGHLDVFEQKIPNIYRNKLRLERISPNGIQNIIIKMFKPNHRDLEKLKLIAELIVNNVKDKNTGGIDLPFLQVYLEKIKTHINNDGRLLSEDIVNQIGKIDNVMEQHLMEQVELISSKVNVSKDEIWILLKLLVNKNSKKNQTVDNLIETLKKE